MRSLVIVALQIGLITAIALPFGGAGWSPAASVLVGLGVVLGLWALTANRPGNFNIRPEPKSGGRLATAGPYALVRHPMYLALLVATLGFCVGYGEPWRWLAFAALGAVLAIKMNIEEAALTARHPGYVEYARATKRLIPFVW
jgi:protein-S-isoprenylcysteine O-methyltransferase Ste14